MAFGGTGATPTAGTVTKRKQADDCVRISSWLREAPFDQPLLRNNETFKKIIIIWQPDSTAPPHPRTTITFTY